MYCPKCGSQNKYNAISCENCGASLFDLADIVEDAEAAKDDPFADIPAPKNPGANEPRREREKKEKKQKPERPAIEPEYHEDDTALERFYYKTVARFQSYNERVNSSLESKFENNGEKAQQAKEKVQTKYNNVKDDIKGDKAKQKKLLAAIGAVLLLILLLVVGSYAWNNCTACVNGGFIGTYGEINGVLDGYDSADIILEFRRDGKVYSGGDEIGSYEYSNGVLSVDYNGLKFTANASTGDKQVALYMNTGDGQISEYAGMTLVRLSSKTELEKGEISKLYPKE